MPRTARASIGGHFYHVINRGNARNTVFHNHNDYQDFIRLLGNACERLPLDVLAFCLMPNHFHLVLHPYQDGDLSRWMQWLMTSHVRRHHRRYGTDGRIWQGRFKAFPIQKDNHLITVVRYVERNALRSNLVKRAENWLWGSLYYRVNGGICTFLAPMPIALTDEWTAFVNRAESAGELETLRQSVNRGAPFGTSHWKIRIAGQLQLESSLRPRGRPYKNLKK
jgi:putative transposase